MGKRIKGNASRTPPEPTEDHSEIEAWIGGLMPDLQPVVRALDEMIRDAIPGLRYAIKWKRAFYGRPKLGWLIELVAYDVSVNIVFHGGADFDDPPPLGDTGRSRYVKVSTLAEAKDPAVRGWIEDAGRIMGWT